MKETMDKLVKVMKGLEACIKGDCRENACPYALENECRKSLESDALELLKAAYPEPHLLTRDELYEVKPGTVLWKDHREDPDDAGTWFPITPVYFVEIKQMAFFDGWDEEDVICFADEFERVSDYGAYEVYWTSRPTDEQRKEAEWE